MEAAMAHRETQKLRSAANLTPADGGGGSAASGALCELCDTSVVSHRCVECSEMMCDSCTAVHRKMRATRSHTIQTLAAFESNGPPTTALIEYCPIHPTPREVHELTLCCKTCNYRLICRDCIVVDHRDHEYNFVNVYAAERRQEVAAACADIEQLSVVAAGAVQNVRDESARSEARGRELTAELRAAFGVVMADLREQEAAAVAAVERAVTQKVKQLAAQSDALTVHKASLDSYVKYVQDVLARGSDVHMLLSRELLLTRKDELAGVDSAPPLVATADLHATLDTTAAQTAIGNLGIVSDLTAADFAVGGLAIAGPLQPGTADLTIRLVDTSVPMPQELHFVASVHWPWGGGVAESVPVQFGARDGLYVGHLQIPREAPGGQRVAADATATVEVSVHGVPLAGSPFVVPVTLDHECRFTGDFDTNGALYWIGTNGGTEAYQNPHTAGRVQVQWSSVSKGNVEDFVAHASPNRSAYTRNTANSWMQVDLGANRRVVVNHYCLRSDEQTNCCKLRNWRLEGSLDGTAWTALRTHANDSGLAFTAFSTANWAVPGQTQGYRFFRIVQYGKCSSGCNNLLCAGIEFYGVLQEL